MPSRRLGRPKAPDRKSLIPERREVLATDVEAVFVDDPCDCLEVSVDKSKLGPGESAKLTVQTDIALSQEPRAFSIQVYARPTMKLMNLILRLP